MNQIKSGKKHLKKTVFLSIMTSISLLSHEVSANIKYVATPQESNWTISANSPVRCQLIHPIPFYGNASFSAESSRNVNLDFRLAISRGMPKTTSVTLLSMPASWMPGDRAQEMKKLKFFKQFDGYIDGQEAWQILAELEKGRFPTFSFPSWEHKDELIQVALSAVSFRKSYQDFSLCIQNLFPYSFNDVALSVLHFTDDGAHLTITSKKRLQQIIDFVNNSDDIDYISIGTHTDTQGSKEENQAKSDLSAKVLLQYFEAAKFPKERVLIESYGKTRPIADDEFNPIGKAQNRRAVVTLVRNRVN